MLTRSTQCSSKKGSERLLQWAVLAAQNLLVCAPRFLNTFTSSTLQDRQHLFILPTYIRHASLAAQALCCRVRTSGYHVDSRAITYAALQSGSTTRTSPACKATRWQRRYSKYGRHPLGASVRARVHALPHCLAELQLRDSVGGVQVYDTSSAGRVLWNDEWPNGTVTFTLAHAKGLQPALPATCGLIHMQWMAAVRFSHRAGICRQALGPVRQARAENHEAGVSSGTLSLQGGNTGTDPELHRGCAVRRQVCWDTARPALASGWCTARRASRTARR